jgi:hypothetical protein
LNIFYLHTIIIFISLGKRKKEITSSPSQKQKLDVYNKGYETNETSYYNPKPDQMAS